MNRANELLLAGDLGGTKTALAIYSRTRGPRVPIAQATFFSKESASMEALVREFLAGTVGRVARTCVDVAGPLVLGWMITDSSGRVKDLFGLTLRWLLYFHFR